MILYSIDKELKNKVCRWFEGIPEMVEGLKTGETRELDIIGFAKRAGEYVEKHGISDERIPSKTQTVSEVISWLNAHKSEYLTDYAINHFDDLAHSMRITICSKS